MIEHTSSERRQHTRYKAHFAVGIDGGEKKGRLGIAQAARATGVLLNTRSLFAASEQVLLTLHALPTGAKQVQARLVRVEEVPKDSSYPWRYLAAAVFAEPIPALEAALIDQPPPSS